MPFPLASGSQCENLLYLLFYVAIFMLSTSFFHKSLLSCVCVCWPNPQSSLRWRWIFSGVIIKLFVDSNTNYMYTLLHSLINVVNLFDKKQRKFNGENIVFNKWCWNNWIPILKKKKPRQILPLLQKLTQNVCVCACACVHVCSRIKFMWKSSWPWFCWCF